MKRIALISLGHGAGPVELAEALPVFDALIPIHLPDLPPEQVGPVELSEDDALVTAARDLLERSGTDLTEILGLVAVITDDEDEDFLSLHWRGRGYVSALVTRARREPLAMLADAPAWAA